VKLTVTFGDAWHLLFSANLMQHGEEPFE